MKIGFLYGILHALQCKVAHYAEDGSLMDSTTGRYPTRVLDAQGKPTIYGFEVLPIWDACQLAHVRASWSVP